jgi:hypothetical protein
MLTAKQPSEEIVKWAEETNLVKYPQDRPWYYTNPPISIINEYKKQCRCKKKGMKPAILNKYICEDDAGFVYVGQCPRCQAIIWSFWDNKKSNQE